MPNAGSGGGLIEDSELESSVVILRNYLKTRCPARFVPSPLGRRVPTCGREVEGERCDAFLKLLNGNCRLFGIPPHSSVHLWLPGENEFWDSYLVGGNTNCARCAVYSQSFFAECERRTLRAAWALSIGGGFYPGLMG